MHQKGIMISFALIIIIFITTIPGYCTAAASTNEGLTFKYLISYTGGESDAPRVTIVIGNLNSAQIDLVISPMSILAEEDQSLWLVESQQITASGEDGRPVPVTDGGIIFLQTSGGAVQYRWLSVNTPGQSTITIQYVLHEPMVTGYLETFLLRPRDHSLVGNATLQFEIPTNWKAVTVLTEEQHGVFPLGSMDSFYNDNQESVYNLVPAAFAVGDQENIVEIQTNCGRLIYAYHASSPSTIRADSARALLGKAIFEYYCAVVGPLAPYNAYISGMNTEWENASIQPGLYSLYGPHNRTMDLMQSFPTVEYHPWEFNVCPFTTCSSATPDYSGYGFPHKFLRAWLSTGQGGLLYFSNEPDWFLRGGMSYYFHEMAMTFAFGQHKVYERFQNLYNYYQTDYVQAGVDGPIPCSNSNEMDCSFLTNFKSGLFAFYLNQRILEATQGEKNITDLSRYLYAAYAGSGEPLTYTEVQDAVNIVAGTDLGEVWGRYAYGNESLPLDIYFQDDDQDGLLNGLEMERHTDPKSADTDGNDIDDAVEYAMDCARTALDSYYCVGIIPAGAKGSQLIPAIIAMNPHPLGSSDVDGYYGPIEYSIDLGDSAVTLDGLTSDWLNISPLAADPQETGSFDFKSLYGFSDTKNLYLRIDPYENFPSSKPAEFDFEIVAQTDEGPSRFQVILFPLNLEEVNLGHVGDNDQWDSQKTFTGAALGDVLELIIPLEFLGFPKSVTINAYAIDVEGSTRQDLDSFDPAILAIGTTPISTVTKPAATIPPTMIPTDTPAINPVGPTSLDSDWHSIWNSYWWIIPILVGACILSGVVIILRKKR